MRHELLAAPYLSTALVPPPGRKLDRDFVIRRHEVAMDDAHVIAVKDDEPVTFHSALSVLLHRRVPLEPAGFVYAVIQRHCEPSILNVPRT